MNKIIKILSVILFLSNACSGRKGEQKEEQIPISEPSNFNDSSNSILENISMSKIPTVPNAVILTGLINHRLVTVYKSKIPVEATRNNYKYGYSGYRGESEKEEHYMPGIDVLYGYNLLNIAHYDLKTEKLNFLFDRAALIKTLYYPSFIQDSIAMKPINRDYFLVSAYDEDTNKDTLINKKDLRKFYHFNADCSVKTQLIPANYSVLRSQYDSQKDLMYLFAAFDENSNGTRDPKEPIHIFWINLKSPVEAKRLY